jgi:hypothetical protein
LPDHTNAAQHPRSTSTPRFIGKRWGVDSLVYLAGEVQLFGDSDEMRQQSQIELGERVDRA